MQTIVQKLRPDGPVGNPTETVSLVVGMLATLVVRAEDANGDPAPPAGLDNVASWRFVLAPDWDEATVPCYITNEVEYDPATATWTIPLDGTRTAQMLAALGTDGRIEIGCEIAGLDASGEWDRPAYVLQWSAWMLNRRDSAGTPTPVDPQPVALHASTHAADGTDPVTPASIGAATVQDIVERIAPLFVLNAYYAEGALVSSSTDGGTVYRCLHSHIANSWIKANWALATVEDVLAILRGAVAAKYTKPSGGIPASDLAAGVIPVVPTLPFSVANGGTGATTAAGARENLGAVAKSGDAMSGGLTVPNLTVGNRANGQDVGTNSVAEGDNTTASRYASHAEGAYTIASGGPSHAEGGGSTASGNCSHAEGSNTTASGGSSHAEGGGSMASGNCSHAEGCTTASGNYSHAEGVGSTARGHFSHAEGGGSTAQNENEHAQGAYNASHTGAMDSEKTIHSIGVGTSGNARANAVEIMRDGKVFVKGVGGYDGTNPTGQANPATDLATVVNGKQDTIPDIATIRSGAAAGATAVQPGQRNLLDYTTGTTLSPSTAVYRAALNADGAFPTITDSAIPTASAYYQFELELSVPSTVPAAITGPTGWDWLDGGEPPDPSVLTGGETIFVACRMDCATRAVTANVWRVA